MLDTRILQLPQRWEKEQVRRRAFEEQQRKERAAEAERQQREKERVEKIAREDAAREAQAEHLTKLIEGTGKTPSPIKGSMPLEQSYYIGRATSDDVLLIEPLKGRYSQVTLNYGRPDGAAAVGKRWNVSGPMRVKVREILDGYMLRPGQTVKLAIGFETADTMQIRVTMLCVQGGTNPPCRNRLDPSNQP